MLFRSNDASVMGETETRALLVDGSGDPLEVCGEKTALGSAVAEKLAMTLG